LSAASGALAGALALSWILPPQYLRQPFTEGSHDDQGVAVTDPWRSPTKAEYEALTTVVAAAGDDRAQLQDLLTQVEQADLAEDERANLRDRIAFRLKQDPD
jgi:hypothetical protein